MAMTRQQAIDHIWQLSEQVSQEFCCSQRERDELVRETTDALAALGVGEDTYAPEGVPDATD